MLLLLCLVLTHHRTAGIVGYSLVPCPHPTRSRVNSAPQPSTTNATSLSVPHGPLKVLGLHLLLSTPMSGGLAVIGTLWLCNSTNVNADPLRQRSLWPEKPESQKTRCFYLWKSPVHKLYSPKVLQTREIHFSWRNADILQPAAAAKGSYRMAGNTKTVLFSYTE